MAWPWGDSPLISLLKSPLLSGVWPVPSLLRPLKLLLTVVSPDLSQLWSLSCTTMANQPAHWGLLVESPGPEHVAGPAHRFVLGEVAGLAAHGSGAPFQSSQPRRARALPLGAK